MTYDVPGIEVCEIVLTVEARIENGQVFRFEALRIEKPHATWHSVRYYDSRGVVTTLPEIKQDFPRDAIQAALCHLAAQKE